MRTTTAFQAATPCDTTALLPRTRAGAPLCPSRRPLRFAARNGGLRTPREAVMMARAGEDGKASGSDSESRPQQGQEQAQAQAQQQDEEQKQQPDVIERLWNAIFGAKEAEPFGLKRFDRDRFPELYPATLDEFADPVASDDETVALFRPLLARTQLQTRELQLVYDAGRHGWTAEAFHARVDRLGAAVVWCETAGGAVCGGYNPKGFVGYGESRGSKAAFLFCWPDGDTARGAVKLRKVGGAALAVVDDPEAGPSFGADGLVIPLMPPRAQWDESDARNRVARSKLGSYYERRPDGGNCLFADGESGKGTPLTTFRVYTGVYAEGEEIPFNDALPFSLE